MRSMDTTAQQLLHELVATASAIRAVEEPADLVLRELEKDCYDMGVYFGIAATVSVLQDRGLLPVGR